MVTKFFDYNDIYGTNIQILGGDVPPLNDKYWGYLLKKRECLEATLKMSP